MKEPRIMDRIKPEITASNLYELLKCIRSYAQQNWENNYNLIEHGGLLAAERDATEAARERNEEINQACAVIMSRMSREWDRREVHGVGLWEDNPVLIPEPSYLSWCAEELQLINPDNPRFER